MENTKFTGNKDVDMTILNILDDRELGKVCQVNKYANSLCHVDLFWKNRFDVKFGKILKSNEVEEFKRNKRKYENWETFYKYFVRASNYLDEYFYIGDDPHYGKKIKIFKRENEEDGGHTEDGFYNEIFQNPLMTKYFARLARNREYVLLYALFTDPKRLPNYVSHIRRKRNLDPEIVQKSYELIGKEYYS